MRTLNRASCELTYTPSATPSTPVRSDTITADYAGSSRYAASAGSADAKVLSSTLLPSGAFVIGDQNAALGAEVTFSGAQWSKLDSLSGGTAPAAFMGFAANIPNNPPQFGDRFEAEPGMSSDPPGAVPDLMAANRDELAHAERIDGARL
jgi:hypothetical protein